MPTPQMMSRVMRHVPYFLYATLASVVSIAGIVAFFQVLGGVDEAGVLSVLGGMMSPLNEASAHSLAQLKIWLNDHEGIVIGAGIIPGVIGFALFTKSHPKTGEPAWFGAPTGLISFALLWEVRSELMSWIALGMVVLVLFMIALRIILSGGYNPTDSSETFFGNVMVNWMVTVGYALMVPLTLVFGRWEDLLPPKQEDPAHAL